MSEQVQDPILRDLNPEQKQAVLHDAGPLLIFAGAGSGKTRVLTRRIAYLVARRGVDPYRILAVTFTNKAAAEMRERISGMLPGVGEKVWVSTFHSSCARILRMDGDKIGFDRSFTIYDEADQRALVKELLRRAQIDPTVLDPRRVLSVFDEAKNNLTNPADLASDHFTGPARDRFLRIAEMYTKELKANNAMDFGDLIVNTVELLRTDSEVREAYRRRFEYILVDEFQDTNAAQYTLLDLLLGSHRNLCVVGDDDQSIYRWRGANIENILGFADQFPEATKIILGRNYRSSSNILAVADALIRRNTGREIKNLQTSNDPGRPVRLFRADDEYDEARYVADQIRDLVERLGIPPGDIAVFYRINALSRVFEEELMRRGTPFVVVGGTRFYSRKEIKDVLAYWRVIANPADSVSAKRIINTPSRKIGKTTVERIDDFAAEQGLPFLVAARRMVKTEELPAAATKAVAGFIEIVDELTADSLRSSLPDLLEKTLQRTGYRKMLNEDKSVEALSRKENLGELAEAVAQYTKRSPDAVLADYLEAVTLTEQADEAADVDNSVRLMTLHNAKGLEFPAVFMVGMEEAVLPHSRSISSGLTAEIEEERRLAYVGITRAKRYLTLTCAARRRSYSGLPTYARPSRFLDEIPEDMLDIQGFAANPFGSPLGAEEPGGTVYEFDQPRGRNFGSGSRSFDRPRPSTPRPSYASNEQATRVARRRPGDSSRPTGFVPAGEKVLDYGAPAKKTATPSASGAGKGGGALRVGQKVLHAKFGNGEVLSVVGQGPKAKVMVRFGSVGVKTMFLQYANLETV
ncbi:MAG: UvrD-helicase domain-containing protein [Deltaproteobacteria bacterium]|nr:UvrD-helicase domain-containing protein [bacterium]MCB9477773.1 UvrD-helicase domain-containing protein [Deltaproteobacteria bacterium]MCB9488574.1 UvrD-helicase domain-containing protein [Deltaproteobacteria bacterium]